MVIVVAIGEEAFVMLLLSFKSRLSSEVSTRKRRSHTQPGIIPPLTSKVCKVLTWPLLLGRAAPLLLGAPAAAAAEDDDEEEAVRVNFLIAALVNCTGASRMGTSHTLSSKVNALLRRKSNNAWI
jgi:hypothetical protein